MPFLPQDRKCSKLTQGKQDEGKKPESVPAWHARSALMSESAGSLGRSSYGWGAGCWGGRDGKEPWTGDPLPLDTNNNVSQYQLNT